MPKPPAKSAPVASDTASIAQFEQSLAELETLVTRMEAGEMSLDESLRAFERGVALYRSCQATLGQAEARVKLLLDPEHPESARPFAPDAEP
ncbi:MAG: exodeoxyribonuclease VII small subunit [Proteobacteria bacterium]|nr:exodeoxyribonuclease VII small subunit [Pseudomonadota bacterium]